ncbi:hypothetical protein DL89DRAFT_286804 [Linderina pennispora]|uniref:Uncharacterized protein n=1 Tax=Linderina pennispora TaxID=61395 RepID=A0A1Y1VWX9_9FUNG|nr:uncharacterized protein DL89DRAFT_286804 [Linderina pennispora]ORX65713.1 hypothetical protein DL89DRAFT_286804 [Linderina pennispora]
MTFQRLAALSTRARIAPRLVRGGHGAQHFNEPGGYLFGVKPGQKYEKEGWETIWVGRVSGLRLLWRPSVFTTSRTPGKGTALDDLIALVRRQARAQVRTWARQEAERQMREEGDVLEYKHTEYRA